MKLPDDLDLRARGALRRYYSADLEAIVRDCAKVCEKTGLEHSDPFQMQDCRDAILRRYGME